MKSFVVVVRNGYNKVNPRKAKILWLLFKGGALSGGVCMVT